MQSSAASTFSQEFRVRYEECGTSGEIRASVYLRYLQELAFAHSAALGYPLIWYEANRLFWLVRRAQLLVHAPARYGEALTGTTQVVGMRRIFARRRNTIRRTSDGAPLVTVVVDWIFTHDGVVTARIPAEFVGAFPSLEGTVAPAPLEEPDVPPGAVWTPVQIRFSDCDAMGHANNAVYLDLVDDAIIRAGGSAALERYPRTYDLQYHAAARAGAELRDLVWTANDVWHYRLESPDGVPYLHGRLRGGDDSGLAGEP
ncbi:MAG: acyl-[acyl-carrier-protein] thioesterase [Candidatus Methylomirabilaceae bacterium]